MSSISSLKDIKKGVVIIYKDEPHQVTESDFLRMQAAKPVMKTKMRNLITGGINAHNFSHGDKPNLADIDRKKASYLYKDNTGYVFMDSETYEQASLSDEVVGDALNFLTEGTPINLVTWDNKVISLELPPKVELEITQTEPGVRGDTAQGSVTKPATLETGFVVQVPLFVKAGDKVRVNTDTGEYSERVN